MSDFIWLSATQSTNDDAKVFVRSRPVGITERWIGAETQTAGRGRGNRQWESPKGNLYASWVGRLETSLAEASQLSFVAALAVADSVLSYMPEADLSFKWPNDVLLGKKKFSGILLEAEPLADQLWLIVGIGVNVRHAPTEALYPATALGLSVAPRDFLTTLASHFDRLKQQWQKEGFAKIRALWLERAQGIGETIKVRLPQEELCGTFHALNNRGSLELTTSQGLRTIEAGDVFFKENV